MARAVAPGERWPVTSYPGLVTIAAGAAALVVLAGQPALDELRRIDASGAHVPTGSVVTGVGRTRQERAGDVVPGGDAAGSAG